MKQKQADRKAAEKARAGAGTVRGTARSQGRGGRRKEAAPDLQIREVERTFTLDYEW